MIWQDMVMSSSGIIFLLALMPQVYNGFKKKTGPISYLTSIPTFLGLSAVAIALWTLSLYFSSIISFISSALWFLLFIQRLIYKNKSA